MQNERVVPLAVNDLTPPTAASHLKPKPKPNRIACLLIL